MRRFSIALLAIATSLVSTATFAQTQRMGRCHMGECGWTREISRDFAGASQRGYLVQLQIQRGTSTNPGGGPARNKPIKWEKKPDANYVFCSKSLPAVIFPLDGEMNVHLLDLYPGARLPGYQESSVALYMAVCHNVDVHKPYVDPQVYVKRFNYAGERARYKAVEDAIKQPADILKH